MIQDIAPSQYDLSYQIREIEDNDFLVIANEKKQVYLVDNRIPYFKEVKHLVQKVQYLFSIDQEHYFLCLDKIDHLTYTPIRALFPLPDNKEAFALTTAYHLYTWYSKHQYCGVCGSMLKPYDKQRALICECCGNLIFPVIAPAVIVAVRNQDKLLLSRYAGRQSRNYALIAGFCEIGETAEETCVREVMEETGLKIKNIQYYASQPWGTESDLLLGFIADLDGDDTIHVDHEELSEAVWIKREDIPSRDNMKALTATMIEAFKNGEF